MVGVKVSVGAVRDDDDNSMCACVGACVSVCVMMMVRIMMLRMMLIRMDDGGDNYDDGCGGG